MPTCFVQNIFIARYQVNLRSSPTGQKIFQHPRRMRAQCLIKMNHESRQRLFAYCFHEAVDAMTEYNPGGWFLTPFLTKIGTGSSAVRWGPLAVGPSQLQNHKRNAIQKIHTREVPRRSSSGIATRSLTLSPPTRALCVGFLCVRLSSLVLTGAGGACDAILPCPSCLVVSL